ncbi:Hpt domain-containing protein [Thalassospira sp. UBA1131]|uniref:Hpt domain-containing protein n=1 Tax=Thalassospira sp. UBA1131 TaxID=1947672 RepID=UPI0025ED8098|nr:Hpt domain-containing protein [Thalassospira sp. UBA1131]
MELIDNARFEELCQVLGKDQVLLLVNLLPASYDEERARLIEAATTKDSDGIKRSGHAIKGMARNMAASELAEAALAFERFEGDFDPALDDKIKELDEITQQTVGAMRALLATP